MSAIKEVSSNKIFRGLQKTFSHYSNELSCEIKFSIYLPEQTEGDQKVPVLYWLSGLTCTEENFVIKAGAQRYAAEHGLIIVCPDTSPRKLEIPGQDDSYDFGSGAGFYVDATTDLWKKNYRMYSYVTSELIDLINENFPTNGQQSIFGHSMGGHGAIICALKNPGLYKSVSAFAPIANPINCAWGKKAFTGYLGSDESIWKEYDSSELVKKYNGPPLEIYIDQGKSDDFLEKQQLLPENLVNSCKDSQVPVVLNMREGYDHSYFYIATFVGEHIAYHAKFLK